jgi:hypothetical protein
MATGDTLLLLNPLDSTPPATLYATLDTVTGTSTPVEAFPVLDFDDTTQEYTDFHGLVMPASYAGGGLTVTIFYSAAEASTDVVKWEAALRRIADDAEDLDTTAHTYDYNVIEDTAPSAIGEVAYASITFTDGADMDSVAAGELFTLRVSRNPTTGGTDVTGDASIHAIRISET